MPAEYRAVSRKIIRRFIVLNSALGVPRISTWSFEPPVFNALPPQNTTFCQLSVLSNAISASTRFYSFSSFIRIAFRSGTLLVLRLQQLFLWALYDSSILIPFSENSSCIPPSDSPRAKEVRSQTAEGVVIRAGGSLGPHQAISFLFHDEHGQTNNARDDVAKAEGTPSLCVRVCLLEISPWRLFAHRSAAGKRVSTSLSFSQALVLTSPLQPSG